MSSSKTAPRRKRRPTEDYVHYIISVDRWDHYYAFSAHGRTRYEDAGYRRTETLTFNGKTVLPEGFRYQSVEVILSADNNFTDTTHEEFRAVIGTLHAAADTLHAYVMVPGDHMPQLVAVAASGRVKVVSFIGTPLSRRSGTIRNLGVSTSAEDLSDGEEG